MSNQVRRTGRLDKLGVTGSSPVPPIAESPGNRGCFPAGAVNVLVIPEFLWELSLGIYATVWGFRRCRILDEYDSEFPARERHEVAPAY